MRHIALSEDFAEELVAEMLKQDLENLKAIYEDSQSPCPVHYHHPEDVKYHRKMIKALKRVVGWYSIGPTDA